MSSPSKIVKLLSICIVFFSLVACSNETNKKYGNISTNITENVEEYYDEKKIYEIEGVGCEKGKITQTIKEVGVFSNMSIAAETYEICNKFIHDKDKNETTVVVKFETKNENDFIIKTYTSVRPFVTNNGEIVKSLENDTYKTDINANETEIGYIVFNLYKTKVYELKSLNMWWIIAHENGNDNINDNFCEYNKFNIVLE